MLGLLVYGFVCYFVVYVFAVLGGVWFGLVCLWVVIGLVLLLSLRARLFLVITFVG